MMPQTAIPKRWEIPQGWEVDDTPAVVAPPRQPAAFAIPDGWEVDDTPPVTPQPRPTAQLAPQAIASPVAPQATPNWREIADSILGPAPQASFAYPASEMGPVSPWGQQEPSDPRELQKGVGIDIDRTTSRLENTPRFIRDPLVTAVKGIVGVPQSLTGLVDLMLPPSVPLPKYNPTTGKLEGYQESSQGVFGRAQEKLGIRYKEFQDDADTMYSPETKKAYAAVSEAEGILNKAGAALKNPSTILTSIGESLPSMVAGGAIGKGVGALGKAGSFLPKYGFAIGEGAISAGSGAEQTRAESPTGSLTSDQAAIHAASGALTAVVGVLGGKVASKLGIDDIDKLLAGNVSKEIKQTVISRALARTLASDNAFVRATGIAAKVGLGGVQEGTEEAVQSLQEQIASNVAQGKPWYEGWDQATVMGALTGTALGGGMNALSRTQAKKIGVPEEVVRQNAEARANWVKDNADQVARNVVRSRDAGIITPEAADELLAGLQPYLTPKVEQPQTTAAKATSPLEKLAPDVTQSELDWIASKETPTTRQWLVDVERGLQSGNPFPYSEPDLTQAEFNQKSADEQKAIRLEETKSRASINNDVLKKIRSHRDALDVQSKTTFATRGGDEAEGLTRDVSVAGERQGETVTYPGTEWDRSTVERVFPGIVGNAPVRRFHGIWLEEGMRGKGLGQKMFLDAMAQTPDAWFYNSQLEPPATKALAALRKKGLVDVRYRSGANVWSDTPEGNLGSWMARLTEKGREAVGAPQQPSTAPIPQTEPTTPSTTGLTEAGSAMGGAAVEKTTPARPPIKTGTPLKTGEPIVDQPQAAAAPPQKSMGLKAKEGDAETAESFRGKAVAGARFTIDGYSETFVVGPDGKSIIAEGKGVRRPFGTIDKIAEEYINRPERLAENFGKTLAWAEKQANGKRAVVRFVNAPKPTTQQPLPLPPSPEPIPQPAAEPDSGAAALNAIFGMQEEAESPQQSTEQAEAGKAVEPSSTPPIRKIGESQKIMGLESNVVDAKRIDGVDYELYGAAKLKEDGGVIRLFDPESGNVVTLKKYPTYDAAETAYRDLVTKAEAPDLKPPPAKKLTGVKAKPLPQETQKAQPPEAAARTPQQQEEFLRDVIAVMQGQESPEFWPNQNEVQEEAQRRGSDRKAIRDAETEWRQAKADADTDMRRPQPPKAAETPQARSYGTIDAPDRVALGEYFGEQLSGGKAYPGILEARKEAGTLLGGEIKVGSIAVKHVDEAVEQGVVRAARQIVASGETPQEAYRQLQDLYARQPNLAVRTSTSMQQQAYSTPAPLAYLASQLAGVEAGTKTYDAAAGNGMLLIGADTANAVANELNPDRAASLQGQGIATTQNDATQYEPGETFPAVILNPPFGKVTSEDGGEKTWTIDGLTTNQVDHAIALRGLHSLSDDGRAVLILGAKGRDANTPLETAKAYAGAGKPFYKHLYERYNVVDHFTVSGDLYARQGAKFPVDVIVIDGRGKSVRPLPWNINEGGVPKVYQTWEDLGNDKLENVAPSTLRKPKGVVPRPSGSPGGATTAERPQADIPGLHRPTQEPGQVDGGQDRESTTGLREKVDGGRVRDSEPQRRREPGEPSGPPAVHGPTGEPVQSEGGQLSQGRETRQRGSRGDTDGEQRGRLADESTARPRAVEKKPAERKQGEAETEHQVAYAPQSSQPSVDTLLPRNHEAAVKRALETIESSYGDMDTFVATELGWSQDRMNNLSAEQVDAIALAVHNHKKGSGFIIGDQTGVGKGRTVAAMIEYARRQGLIPVFVTKDPGLFADMMRDLTDVGMNTAQRPFQILATNDTLGDKKVELPDGRELASGGKTNERIIRESIGNWENGKGLTSAGKTYDAIFTTYSQLQTVAGNPTWREFVLKQIKGKAYFILDESHEAGGTSAQGGRQKKGAPGHTGRAQVVRDLITDAGGVFYSSATFAKRPDVMDLYSATSMANAVKKAEDLPAAIAEGGVPLQQIVSEMLTEAGQYLRRERSFDGIEFATERVAADLGTADKVSEVYRAIQAFDLLKQDIVESMQADIVSAGGKIGKDSATGKAGIESSTFSSILWNLVDQMLFALKANTAADAAIAAFKNGESPFLVVDNTMETALKRAAAKTGVIPGQAIEFSFKNLLQRYLERSREVLIKDDSGDPPTQHWITDEQMARVRGAAEAYDKAQEIIDNLDVDLPASPIDWIRHKLQKAGLRVAEVTGRKHMVNYADDGATTLAERPDEEIGTSGKLHTVKAYNSGDIDVVIVNRSGATGLSAHASSKFANQKMRRMILAQSAKNIDEFMQILGRVNRTGQVRKPAYTLLMTDAPAENRPAAVLLKKLASLNANVTGAATGAVSFEAPDILNEVGDRIVSAYLWEHSDLNLELGEPAKLTLKGVTVTEGLARKATGRLALMPAAVQEEFWSEVSRLYEQEIEQLNAQGQNPLVAQVISLDAKTLERVKIFDGQEDSSNPFDQPAYLERVDAKFQGKPWKSEKVTETLLKAYPQATSIDDVTPSKWASQQIDQLKQAGVEYEKAATADVSDEQRSNLREQLNNQFTAVSDAMRNFAPGTPVSWIDITGADIPGIVVKFERHGTSKNPLAPSTWVVEVAVVSALGRVRLPVSRLSGEKVELVHDYERRDDRIAQFDSAVTHSKEERWIATGNLLAAHATLSGQNGRIVFFTDADGTQRRGVLMPRSFKGEQWQESRPVVFENPDKALQFLQQGGRGLSSPDTELSVLLVGSNLVLRAPKARSRGGKYTTNQGILSAANPAEFISRGNMMELLVPASKASAVLKATMALTPIQANVDRDLARKILEQEKPQGKSHAEKAAEGASKVLKGIKKLGESRGPLSMTLIPGLTQKRIEALGEVMVGAAQYGWHTFAQFVEAMKKVWGNKWRDDWLPGLQQMWDEKHPPAKEAAPEPTRPPIKRGTPLKTGEPIVDQPSIPPPPEVGTPTGATLPGPETTGTKHAKTDELRAAAGLPERVPPQPETIAQWHQNATDELLRHPEYAEQLVDQLKDRAPDLATIEMVLNLRIAELEQDRRAGRGDLSKLQDVVIAADNLGTAWGRQGFARQVEYGEDWSVPGIIRKLSKAKDGPLSEDELKRAEELAERINRDLQEEGNAASEKAANDAVDAMIAEARNAKTQETRKEHYHAQIEKQYEVANRWGVDPKVLREAAEELASTETDANHAYNVALSKASAALGLSKSRIEDLRNRGKDPATVPGVDVDAVGIANNPDYAVLGLRGEGWEGRQTRDHVEALIRLIDQGRRLEPGWHEKLDEAAKMLSAEKSARGEYGDAWEPPSEASVKPAKEKPVRKTKATRAEKFDSWWQNTVDSAKARLKDIKFTSGLDPQTAADLAIVGADYIKRGVTATAVWAKRMAADFGEGIRPHLKAIWDASQERLKTADDQFKKGTPEEAVEKRADGIDKRFQKTGVIPVDSVKALMRAVVDSGVEEMYAVRDIVHGILQAVDPGITEQETHDLMSGRGQVKRPKDDKTSRTVTDISRRLALIENIQAMQRGEAPLGMGFIRREATDAERELRQQYNEERKAHPELVGNAENQLKGRLQSAETAARNRLVDMEKEIGKRQELADARTRLDEIRKLPADQQIAPMIQELEQQIQDLEGSLRRKAPKPLSSAKLNVDRAKLEELKATRDALREADPSYQADEYQKWLAWRKRQLTTQKANLLAKYAEMERTGKLPPSQRRRERELDPEGRQRLKEREAAKAEVEALARDIQWNNLLLREKLVRGVGLAFKGLKSLWGSWDVSFIGRQGFSLAVSHPIIAAKAQVRSHGAYWSDAKAFAVQEKIRNDPNAVNGIYDRMKLDLTELDGPAIKREELYSVHWPEKIPGYGHGVKASGRAFVAQGNQQRSGVANAMLASMLRSGPNEATDEELQIIGHYVNAASWRGDVGRYAQAAEALNNAFWTTRGFVGNFQNLFATALWAKNSGKGSWRVRRLIAKEFARQLAGRAVFYGTAASLLFALMGPPSGDDDETGWSITLNPYHTNFGKVRIGRRRIDIMGGLGSYARVTTRLSTNVVNGIAKIAFGRTPSKEAEKEMKATGGIVSRFLGSKIAPIGSLAEDVASGEDYDREEVTAGSLAYETVTPLSMRDVYESMTEFGLPGGIALSVLAIYGFGGQTYKPPKKKSKGLKEVTRTPR